MSEYQYYEFRAIDRPLSAADIRWLRGITSRAQITATSLTNTYHWGDFKGDPLELLQRCFDAHVYTSNFGIRRLMLKIPADAREQRAMQAYHGDFGVALSPYSNGIVVDFSLEGEPGEWADGDDDCDDDAEDGSGWMASLAALRADLRDGDRRSLYLAWLLNVQFDVLDDDVREPPVPPGLGALSAPCEALVDFLHVDRELLAVAAERSPPLTTTNASEGEWRELLAGLAATEKDELLLQFITHDDDATRRSLRKRLRQRRPRDAAEPGNAPHRPPPDGRTAGELAREWRRRVAIAQKRAGEAAARERARVADEQARARRAHLTQVAAREPAAWSEVESLIASRTPKGYEQAVALLVDLRDAAALVKRSDLFVARLRELRAAHASKSSLMRRMNTAELR